MHARPQPTARFAVQLSQSVLDVTTFCASTQSRFNRSPFSAVSIVLVPRELGSISYAHAATRLCRECLGGLANGIGGPSSQGRHTSTKLLTVPSGVFMPQPMNERVLVVPTRLLNEL